MKIIKVYSTAIQDRYRFSYGLFTGSQIVAKFKPATMKKISTLFKKDPSDLGRVIPEANPENQWVFDGKGIPTRKFDGTAAAVIDGQLYKRYDVKKGKLVPAGAIPCQDPDPITGHWPHWVLCDIHKPEDKYFFDAITTMNAEGTYELCGPKVQGNPEGFAKHTLVRHGAEVLELPGLAFHQIKQYLTDHDIEGIVFHHVTDGRMCKIRKSDFGIKREVKKPQTV